MIFEGERHLRNGDRTLARLYDEDSSIRIALDAGPFGLEDLDSLIRLLKGARSDLKSRTGGEARQSRCAVLETLAEAKDEAIQIKEIKDATGLSRPTIEKALRALIADHVVKFHVQSDKPGSPVMYWRL